VQPCSDGSWLVAGTTVNRPTLQLAGAAINCCTSSGAVADRAHVIAGLAATATSEAAGEAYTPAPRPTGRYVYLTALGAWWVVRSMFTTSHFPRRLASASHFRAIATDGRQALR